MRTQVRKLKEKRERDAKNSVPKDKALNRLGKTKELAQEGVEKAKIMVDGLTTKENYSEESEEPDLYEGLTERQQAIAQLNRRGVTQVAMARVFGVSQPVISREMKVVRTFLEQKGKTVNQDLVIGDSMSVFEEIEAECLKMYQGLKADDTSPVGDKLKTLQLLMTAREKQLKLLIETGKVDKAAGVTTHKVELTPLIEKWTEGEAQQNIKTLIQAQLPELEAPKPPEDTEEEFIDVESE